MPVPRLMRETAEDPQSRIDKVRLSRRNVAAAEMT